MMTERDFAALRSILLENSGHSLSDGKGYLVTHRLTPVAASLGFESVAALVRHARLAGDSGAVRKVCEAMTTNESLFFRDGVPFDFLMQRLLPDLAARRDSTRRIRIWSAGASTGQEAYSIAMSLADREPSLRSQEFEILGTDYSGRAIERARHGLYNHFEVQRGLTAGLLLRHFRQVEDGWQISDALRKAVDFRVANLVEPFGHLGRFDVIFCRNVLIYLAADVRAEVLDRITEALAPDGFLVLGSSETARGSARLVRLEGSETSVYRRSDHPDFAANGEHAPEDLTP